MKISVIVSDSLESASRRIKICATNFYVDLANRNVHLSTFAVTGTFDELSKSLSQEIKDIFSHIQKVKLGIKELNAIQKNLYSFVENVFEEWKQYLIEQKTYSVGGETIAQQHEVYISNRISEAKTVINLEYLMAKEKLMSRRRQFYWDLAKIGVTATAGGIIGAYIKSIFP